MEVEAAKIIAEAIASGVSSICCMLLICTILRAIFR